MPVVVAEDPGGFPVLSLSMVDELVFVVVPVDGFAEPSVEAAVFAAESGPEAPISLCVVAAGPAPAAPAPAAAPAPPAPPPPAACAIAAAMGATARAAAKVNAYILSSIVQIPRCSRPMRGQELKAQRISGGSCWSPSLGLTVMR